MADAGSSPPGAVHTALPHDSATAHVAGSARYADDMPEAPGTLHLAVGLAPEGRGRIVRIDLTEVRAAPGVVAVFTAADIPGVNDVSPVFGDDPLFVEDEILYPGQPLYVVAATSNRAARGAARLAVVEIEPLPALISIDAARAAGAIIEDTQYMQRGDVVVALVAALHLLSRHDA